MRGIHRTQNLIRRPDGRANLGDLGVNGSIKLKYTLRGRKIMDYIKLAQDRVQMGGVVNTK